MKRRRAASSDRRIDHETAAVGAMLWMMRGFIVLCIVTMFAG